MKTFLILLVFTLGLYSFKTFAQCTTPITYSIQVTPETCNGCCDGTAQVVNLQGGCPIYVCVWSQGANTIPVTGLCAGSYTCTIYDNNCCPPVSQSCFIAQGATTTALQQLKTNNAFQIYPNPNNGSFVLSHTFLKDEIKIFNALGQQIDFTTTVNNSTSINIVNKIKGIYFIEIRNNDNLFRKKIIIE